MKNTKRFSGIAAAALVTASVLTGCGSSAADTAAGTAAQLNGGIYYEETNQMAADSIAETESGLLYGESFSEEYFNTEEYNYIKESGYTSVAANPLSTFSADVDTASYTNLRRIINEGWEVDYSGAVRIEEMINYFDYHYPQPKENEPFSVTTEISDCPWNADSKLMLVGLHTKDIDLSGRPAMNIVFLIDVSGSMYDDTKLPLVQKSFSMLTENLDASDRVSIVTYAGADEIVLEGADGNDKDKILEAINSLEAGGSTAGAAGISTAYRIAEKYFIEGGNNRIVLATDGDLNVGISSESELTALVEEKRETGVFLSVLGFGSGNIKDNKMEALADNGNGNYSYIDSELEAKRVLVEEMSGTLFTAAKDVKIQVEFNPAYIKGYRLIGYENRALADEDFTDDTKDAGEVGAGHSVTALYEIITADSEKEFDSEELKYRSEEAAGVENGEWLTVSIRYKEPDSDTSKLTTSIVSANMYDKAMSERMTFAAGVAEFGLVLRDSEYKGTASCQSILDMLSDYDYSQDEYKDEFIYLVQTMKRKGY